MAAVVACLDEVSEHARIERAVSLHSIGRMILMPYGGSWGAPANIAQFRRVAAAIRERIPERYTVKQSSRWVPGLFAHGMELDHLLERYGALALLVECSMGGVSLRDFGSLLQPFRWFNPRRPERIVAQVASGLEPFTRGS